MLVTVPDDGLAEMLITHRIWGPVAACLYETRRRRWNGVRGRKGGKRDRGTERK